MIPLHPKYKAPPVFVCPWPRNLARGAKDKIYAAIYDPLSSHPSSYSLGATATGLLPSKTYTDKKQTVAVGEVAALIISIQKDLPL